jgi:peptidoglycan hydrolase-like amidase
MALVSLSPSPAAAYPTADVSLVFHGWGHGRGMGQYGALGYAFAGTAYQSILQHYYGTLAAGGTTHVGVLAASNPERSTGVKVDLTWHDGSFPIVTSASAFSINGHVVAAGHAAEIVQTSATNAQVWIDTTTTGCGGPWPSQPQFTTSNAVATPGQAEPFPDNGTLRSKVLQVCRSGGNEYVRGSIWATRNSLNQDRTVDIVPLEQYVADSAPAESPSSWGSLGNAGPQGRPWGFQETEAQVVATRSYVASSPGGYGGYADTCDSTACQSYPGIQFENAVTDAAVQDTEVGGVGQVVLLPSGAAARTEYSASTGGYTAPGTFAAVPDAGDGVCAFGVCNPFHTYNANIPASAITATFPQLGTLEAVTITQRNGFGAFGGRVLQMQLVGSAATVSLTGDQFAADFFSFGEGGFAMSDWFAPPAPPPPPAVVAMARTADGDGYWMVNTAGAMHHFGDAADHGTEAGKHLNAPIVGMAATPDGGGYWLVAADGGIFTFGDATFHGSTGAMHLNKPIVGMAPTPDGKGYWLVAADGGIFRFGDATFHGSTGGMHLNKPVVGMAPTADGKGYWLVAADGGIFTFGDATFHGSTGAMHLNKPIVGMAATRGQGYWLVAADGGIFTFGNAVFHGSAAGHRLNRPVTGMAATPDAGGYWLVAADGGIFTYGDATYHGSGA